MTGGEEGGRGVSGWPAIPAALVAALAGQFLLTAGRIGIGAGLYLAAVVLLLLPGRRGMESARAEDPSLSRSRAALLLILVAAFFLRRLEIASIPWGLNNDEGIEGLIACRFLGGEKIAPFSSIGLSRETLYHLLLVPLFGLLGPGIHALRLLSLLCALATLPVLYFTGKELFSARTGILASALLAFSPWHLLYSRTGFRSILLPLFVLAALGCFHRALRTRRPAWFVATGMVLGTGMYSYTSFRIIPLVLLAWVLLRRTLLRRPPLSWKEAACVLLPFLVLMIPQGAYALRSPAEFLARGGYVLAQTPTASLSGNLLFSLLMPIFYPGRYGVMQSLYYFGDGVSLVYAAVGRTPETAVSAALMACGILLAAVRLARRRGEGEMALLLCFGLTVATVGLAGPSLTRMMGNLPLLCLAGGLFLEETGTVLARRFSPAAGRGFVLILLAAASLLCFEQYFLRAGTSRRAMFYFAAPQTLMGLYATSREPDLPVLIFHSEEPETLQFLTFTRRRWVSLERDPGHLDLEKIRAMPVRQEIIVENHPRFATLLRSLSDAFPAAERTYLTDAWRASDRKIAYILDLPPGPAVPSSSAAPPGSLAPGGEPPEP